MSEPDLSPKALKDAVMTLDDGRGGTWVAAEDYVELSAECASLSARLQAAEAERDALREALKRITWVLDEDHGAMEATAVRYARAALASRQEPPT